MQEPQVINNTTIQKQKDIAKHKQKMEKKLGKELVFIASPLMGHLMPSVELAKLMINREERLSITFILIKLPTESEVNAFINTLSSTMLHKRLRFLTLPPPLEHKWTSTNRGVIFDELISYHKPQILHTISKLITQHGVDAIVVDLLSTTLIQVVADEFGIPGYVFFTSGAGFLGLMLHFQTLEDEFKEDTAKLKYSTTHLHMPCFVKPVPPAVLPSVLADYATWTARFLKYARGCRKAKGILVNTYQELESYPLSSFSVLDSSSCYGKPSIPEIHAVGPIIYQSLPQDNVSDGLMKWLDDQPPLSVVFLCFGSMGSFGVDQVREIANGIEQSQCPFVWVLRQPPTANQPDFPSEVVNFEDLLPEGFMDRTSGIGKIMGWVPQLTVLSHRAVGGFVSHCGWNSVLESLWCGVPILAWPLYAEQKLNAFQMVKELGLAIEIPATVSDHDYKDKAYVNLLTKAESIEKGIRRLIMDEDVKVIRKKIAQMTEKSRENMQEGGSSYESLGNFIHNATISKVVTI